jgi:low affinity Fe/Cu permease
MVFLIQRSQNKDTLALQLKLNEVVAALKGASNRLIDIENLSEEDVRELSLRYRRMAERLSNGEEMRGCHTVEEKGL